MANAIKNDIFDFVRFKNYFVHEITERKKLLLIGMAAMFFGLFGFELLVGMVGYAYTDESMHPDVLYGFFSVIYAITLSVGMLISASLSFSDFTRKTSRMNFLVLPASTLEKFITKILIYCVGFTVIMSGICFAVDALRVGLFSLIYSNVEYKFLHNSIDLISIESSAVSVLCSNIFFEQAIYVLGATIFTRYAFLKTFLAKFIINNMLGLLLIIFSLVISDSLRTILDYFFDNCSALIWNLIMAVVCIGIYYLSYRIVKHKQLV